MDYFEKCKQAALRAVGEARSNPEFLALMQRQGMSRQIDLLFQSIEAALLNSHNVASIWALIQAQVPYLQVDCMRGDNTVDWDVVELKAREDTVCCMADYRTRTTNIDVWKSVYFCFFR